MSVYRFVYSFYFAAFKFICMISLSYIVLICVKYLLIDMFTNLSDNILQAKQKSAEQRDRERGRIEVFPAYLWGFKSVSFVAVYVTHPSP